MDKIKCGHCGYTAYPRPIWHSMMKFYRCYNCDGSVEIPDYVPEPKIVSVLDSPDLAAGDAFTLGYDVMNTKTRTRISTHDTEESAERALGKCRFLGTPAKIVKTVPNTDETE